MNANLLSLLLIVLFELFAVCSLPAGELLKNGGFESGDNGDWSHYNVATGVASSAGVLNNSNNAHSQSSWYGYLGDFNSTTFHARGVLRQVVTLPSNVSTVTLKFYLNITSSQSTIRTDTSNNQFDKMTAELTTYPDDVSIAFLGEWSNLSRDSGGVKNNYFYVNGLTATDVSAYAGKQIILKFYAQTDDSLETTFRIDDVSLFANTVQSPPDLTPYQLPGWNDKIPVGTSKLTGESTHNYNGSYYDNQKLYFNWASINQGGSRASGYTVHFEVTGTGGSSWDWTSQSTDPTFFNYLITDEAVGPLASGNHTFKLWLDYNANVSEGSNESNNYYERTINVQASQETVTSPGSITGEPNPIRNTPYTYTVGASASNLGHTVEYSFDWGDGTSSQFTTSTSAEHAWTTTGQKSIVVIARCQSHTSISNNNSPGKTVSITTDANAPKAIIAGDRTPVTGQTTYYGTSSTGQELKFLWTTSDGQKSTYANASLSFNSPGKYSIYLTVTDSSARTDSASLNVNVQAHNNGINSESPRGADPVILSSGNYIQNQSDIRLASKGFPFEFRRFYNSKFSDQSGTPLGYGWTFNYNVNLRDTGTNVLIIQGDGSVLTYFRTNNSFVPESGVFDILKRQDLGPWTLTDKNNTQMVFNGITGQLVTVTDKNNNTLSLTYNGAILSKIEDPSGRVVQFDSNSLGCIASLIDPIGRVYKFEYDSNTNLVAVINANNQTNRYSYDRNHQMTDAFNARGIHYIHNEYDPNWLTVISQYDAYTNWTFFYYDFTNHVTHQTNSLGKTAVYRFDDQLLITNIIDEAGTQQFFAYDSNRNRILIENRNGNQIHYTYDLRGNVTGIVDAMGNRSTIEYDASNNPIKLVDARGNTSSFLYDANGNLNHSIDVLGSTSKIEYTNYGLPFITTDARGYKTTNKYDIEGNLVAVTDAKGFVKRFEYDSVGRKIREIDALNRTNNFFYDNNDNLITAVNPLGFTNLYVYDENNNRILSRNPRNSTTTNLFDLKDRLSGVIGPLNLSMSNKYDALDRRIISYNATGIQTTYGFDNVGNLVAHTNAAGQAVHFSFDGEGNQTSVIDSRGHYVTNFFDPLNHKFSSINLSISTNGTAFDALGLVVSQTNGINQVIKYYYDALRRLTNVVDANGKSVMFTYDENSNRTSTTDQNGHTWTNVFDELNHLIESHDANNLVTTIAYDSVGNISNKHTPNNENISYLYDDNNRLTIISYSSGATVRFTYDSAGNRTSMHDSLGVTLWEYDLLNRLIRVVGPYGQEISYGYDYNGNRIYLVYPGGNVVRYGFDSLNRLTSLTNWMEGVITYSYDDLGNVASVTNANNTVVLYGHDLGNRIVSLTNIAQNGHVIASYNVTLDGVGNQLRLVAEQPIFPTLSSHTNTYSYDLDNRLVSMDGYNISHNLNGDITAIGSSLYTYDEEDRLTQVTLTNSTFQYSYDGLGNRLNETKNGTTRRFVFDRSGEMGKVIMETDDHGSPIAYYLHGLGVAEVITTDGQTSTFHFNPQGSTVAITDLAGIVTDSYAYDSFGSSRNATGPSRQPFRYLGRYGIIDEGNGLLDARARHFSPDLGRFLSKDPLAGRDNDGQSLNRYVYALNNPLLYRDVNGLCPQSNGADLSSRAWSSLGIFDQAAWIILTHWLNGKGQTLDLSSKEWQTYLKSSSYLSSQIADKLRADAILRTASGNISLSFHADLDSGGTGSASGWRSGTGLLGGSNSEVGDFQINGTANVISSGDAQTISYDLKYQWNDKIDPNRNYWQDTFYSSFIKTISFGQLGEDYAIHLGWKGSASIQTLNQKIISVSGYPFK